MRHARLAMKRLACVCAIFGAVALAPVSFSAQGTARVLVVTGGHAFEAEPFFRLFRDDPAIMSTASEHTGASATAWERDDLAIYDVVVLYDMPRTITPAQQAQMRSLFERGTGLVVLHHALVSFQGWPDYERIIGGRYPEPPKGQPAVSDKVGYEHGVEVPVTILDAAHPITAGMKDFTIRDEIYWGFRVGGDVHPLLGTTHPRAGQPLMWTRTEGKSRVVFLQLGHDHHAFENPNFRELVARSISWAARR
jgi:type 1 glutamine amidotransferase